MPTTEPHSDSSSPPRLIPTLKADVGRVIADVMKRGPGHEIRGTLSDLETFYLDEETRARLLAKRGGGWLHRLGWLLKSLLLKLTPARRVLLAAGLLLIVSGIQRIDVRNVHVELQFPVAGDALILLVLMLELKDKLLARHELEAGRRVQLALMPDRQPPIPGWDAWLYTEPANDVGGDLVDHLPIDARRHAVVLGDVAGKALPAALLMVKLQATLRALIPDAVTLGDLGAAVNRILVRDGLPNRFATLVYLALTTDSGVVRVLNAGHLPPLVLRGRTLEELPRGSMALGFMPDATFAEQSVDLAEGDALIVFSDGVTEAMNAAGDFFGDDRLRAAIIDAAGQPAQLIGTRIVSAIEMFVGDAPRHDDVSIVILRRRASTGARA